MGKSAKKKSRDDDGDGKRSRGRLFSRHRKSSVAIDSPQTDTQAEAYRAIGRVNHRHLQHSQSWDIKYLGCVPGVKDWQSPDTRSEFMELVDQGQASGHLMWYSLTPKVLHISPRWFVITDNKKKVTYTEMLVRSVGSLSYAEDEGKHILGIKTVSAATASASSTAAGKSAVSSQGVQQYCCHVIECVSEILVRQICTAVNEYFRQLLQQQEERQRQIQEQIQQQQLKTKMVKKLEPAKSEKSSQATSRKASQQIEQKEVEPQHMDVSATKTSPGVKRKDARHVTREEISHVTRKEISHVTREEISPISRKRVGASHVTKQKDYVARKEVVRGHVIKKEGGLGHRRDRGRREVSGGHGLELPFSEDLVLREWTTNFHPPAYPSGEIMEEIGRQFSAVIKEPSRRGRRGQGLSANLKRLSTVLPSSFGRKSKGHIASKKRESDESIAELLPAMKPSRVAKHNGNVITQELPDTQNIKLSKNNNSDYLVPKGKPRAPLVDMKTSDGKDVAPPPLVPPPVAFQEHESKEQDYPESPSTLRTGFMLETMEEGEKETRIDGDTQGTVLVQTTMGDKETAILGGEGSATLLPTSELNKHEQQPTVAAGPGGSSVPAPRKSKEKVASAPPISRSTHPPAPPPQHEKPFRKPWRDLIGLNDNPRNPAHKSYLNKVSSELGIIEYRQFRQHWLDYQKCKTDVVVFCKKTKLIFRGERAHLREGARVLVDPSDRDSFDDVLAGKVVDAKKKTSSIMPPPPPPISIDRGSDLPTKPFPSEAPPSRASGPSSISRPFPSTTSSSAPPRGPPPASSGSLGDRLKMFETSSNISSSKPMAADIPKPGSIAKLISAQESDTKPTEPASEKPKRSGILSKIAAFEGGGPINRDYSPERDTTPSHGKTDRKRKDEDRDDGKERKGQRSRDDRKGKEKGRRGRRRDDSDSDSKNRSKKDKIRRRGGRERDDESPRKHGRDVSPDDRKSRRHREKRDSSYSGSDSEEERSRHRHHKASRDDRKKRSKDRKKKRDPAGLQEILDAGSELLHPAENTIDALAKLLSDQEDMDFMKQANQFLGPRGSSAAMAVNQFSTPLPTQQTVALAVQPPLFQASPPQFAVIQQPPPVLAVQQPMQAAQPQPVVQQPPPVVQQPPPAIQQPMQAAQPPPFVQQPMQAAQPPPFVQQPMQAAAVQQPTPVQQLQPVVQQPPPVILQPMQAAAVQQPPPVTQQPMQAAVAQQPPPVTQQPMQAAQPPPFVQQPMQAAVAQQLTPVTQQLMQAAVAQQAPIQQQLQPVQVQGQIQYQPMQQAQSFPQQIQTAQIQPPQQQLAGGIAPVPNGIPPPPLLPNIEGTPQPAGIPPQPNFNETFEQSQLTRFSEESEIEDENVIPGPPAPPAPPPLAPPIPPPLGPPVLPPLAPPVPPPLGPPVPPPPAPPAIGSVQQRKPSQPDVHSERDNLLSQIRQNPGQILKATTTTESQGPQGGVSMDMMIELKAGKKLRNVSEEEKNVHRRGRGHEHRREDRHEHRQDQERREHRRDHREERHNRRGRDDDDSEEDNHRRHHKHRDDRRRDRHGDRRGSDEDSHSRRRGRGDSDEDRYSRRHDRHGSKKRANSSDDDSDHRSPAPVEPKLTWRERQQLQEQQQRQQGQQGQRRISKTGSEFKGISAVAGDKNVPSWKASLVKRKQEREVGDEYEPEEVQDIIETGSSAAKRPSAPKTVPAEDENEESIPAWKGAMMKRRQQQVAMIEQERLDEIAQEEAMYAGLPEWKKKLMKKKDAEKEAKDAVVREKMQAAANQKARLAEMPEWKRQLIFEKTPDLSF